MMLNLTLGYPITDPIISHPFGEDNTNNPVKKDFYKLFDNKHPGIDFLVDIGTQVFSSFPGIVVRKEFHKGMGNVLGIRYGNIVVLYTHLSKYKVELSQIVKKGEIIGLSGNSGSATTEPHLHLEIRDITKPTLKDMVFDPPFEKGLKIMSQFIYKVNNSGTIKTLKFLSIRYFGDETYWKRILLANKNLSSNPQLAIPSGKSIRIPNYL